MIYFVSVLAMAILSYRRTNLLEVTNLQAAQVCMLRNVILLTEWHVFLFILVIRIW